MRMCRGQRRTLPVLTYHAPPYGLETGFLPNLELSHGVSGGGGWLAGWIHLGWLAEQPPAILLFLPS